MEHRDISSAARRHKQLISSVFDQVCGGYDDAALRFFPFTAAHIVSSLHPLAGWKVLDVATGTGALAVALAQAVGPSGRVLGIDLSEGMLDQASKNVKKMALNNVDFLLMDAEQPTCEDNYFNAVTCSFGLFFLPDMAGALRQWRRVTRPGGRVMFSSFTERAFRQPGEQFVQDLEAAGLDMSEKTLASARLKDADVCRELMLDAGFSDIQQEVLQVGYYLRDAEQWWSVVWNSAMRGLVASLGPDALAAFRREHLAHVAELSTGDGLWLDVEVRLTSGAVS
ncbi:MAG: class I SAM-dependent methyltransferase [Gammaproteobacteria bacterium]|nr:class I SAM-dependent methyltransferase [Gammaproteobacteria bacterium]